VDEAPTKGASIPDSRVAHEEGGFYQEWDARTHEMRALDGVLASHGAKPESAVLLLDVRQRTDPVDVDQGGRSAQAEVHERDKALPPCQDLCISTVPLEQGQRLLDRCRLVVFEGSGLHRLIDLLGVRPISW